MVGLVEVLGRVAVPWYRAGIIAGDPGVVWRVVQTQECLSDVHHCAR